MARHSSMKGCVAAIWAVLLTGCSNLPDWSLFGPLHQDEPAFAATGNYDFSWSLSGDRRAGPLQVFDDGQHMWLQFAPEQPIPAIFIRTEQGDRLLSYQRQQPYVRLDGVWPLLVLRAGGLESLVQRLASTPNDAPEVAPSLDTPPLPEALPAAAADAISAAVPSSVADASFAANASSTVVIPDEPLVHIVSPITVRPSYQVSPEDGNIRLALSRWASSAGWTFQAEHWAVDVDIPIVGSAAFELVFDEAVQQLLASTELSDRPLQPCFYANRVLRVVPYAQSCDRTASPERA